MEKRTFQTQSIGSLITVALGNYTGNDNPVNTEHQDDIPGQGTYRSDTSHRGAHGKYDKDEGHRCPVNS